MLALTPVFGNVADIHRQAAYATLHQLQQRTPHNPDTVSANTILETDSYSASVTLTRNTILNAINASSWTPVAKEGAIFLVLNRIMLIGQSNGAQTSGTYFWKGYEYCWSRTTVHFHDPWFVQQVIITLCHKPTPTPTPTPRPTSTPTPSQLPRRHRVLLLPQLRDRLPRQPHDLRLLLLRGPLQRLRPHLLRR